MRRALLTFPVVLLTLTSSADVRAYQVMETDEGVPVHWADDGVAFVLDASGTDQLSLQSVEGALTSATSQYTQVSNVSLTVSYGGQVNNPQIGYRSGGNQNVVAFFDDAWSYSGEALAITLSTWRLPSGELLDADIVVNSYQYDWATNGSTNAFDLAAALTHEMGHAMGLAHSTSSVEATMYPSMSLGETRKRDLHADDIAGMQFLYGTSDEVTPDDPPADDPPADDPPADDPPADDPPADDPAASDPPAEDPPASDAPAEDDSTSDPSSDSPADDSAEDTPSGEGSVPSQGPHENPSGNPGCDSSEQSCPTDGSADGGSQAPEADPPPAPSMSGDDGTTPSNEAGTAWGSDDSSSPVPAQDFTLGCSSASGSSRPDLLVLVLLAGLIGRLPARRRNND